MKRLAGVSGVVKTSIKLKELAALAVSDTIK
jgi:hypothetical protein